MSHDERLSRLQALLTARELSGAILSDPGSVCYLTRYATPVETGPNPFWGGPALAVVPRQGPVILVVADTEAVTPRPGTLEVVTYQSYVAEGVLNPWEHCHAALIRVVREMGLGRLIGVERSTLPLALGDALREIEPGLEYRDIRMDLARLRAVKTPDELEQIRAAIRLCDIGQQAVKELARPGLTELELFGAVRTRIESAAGQRLPLLADMISGPRTVGMGGPPTGRDLQEGDAILVDLVPCLNGYWGDSCNTVIMGKPSSTVQHVFGVVRDALEAGTAAIRPGLAASELDTIIRDRIRTAGYDYPHHTGHGLGVTYHEEPRIVPGNDRALEPGMVIALEPGVYGAEGIGMRLEHVVLVTVDRAEILSRFRHTL